MPLSPQEVRGGGPGALGLLTETGMLLDVFALLGVYNRKDLWFSRSWSHCSLPRRPTRRRTRYAVTTHPSRFRSTKTTISSAATDRKSTRLNSSHLVISYAVFC